VQGENVEVRFEIFHVAAREKMMRNARLRFIKSVSNLTNLNHIVKPRANFEALAQHNAIAVRVAPVILQTEQQHLQHVREHELRLILPLLPKGAKILEVGAGMGWQAKALAEHGFEVRAIDVPSRFARVWPVQEYDGEHVPFADESLKFNEQR
jgi:2-polyprenyl-3-methyl-5-hydroxy-6-metoxy-1,4-benzoquinol methylase